MRWTLTLVLSLCLACAAPLRAQQRPPLAATPIVFPPAADALNADERRAIDAWLEGMRKWQRMDRRWHNEPAHDLFGRIVARTPRPVPPSWLEDRCAGLSTDVVASLAAPLGSACRLLAGAEVDPTAGAMRAATLQARSSAEKSEHDSFLTRVHIDGLWTSTASDVRIYGLVGSHIGLVDVGRVQFFGPPGVILLSVPDARGFRQIKPGYTWGLSVRLGDVRLFAPSKNLTLFLTIAKVWVPGGTAYDRLHPGGLDIAGFSLTRRKHAR